MRQRIRGFRVLACIVGLSLAAALPVAILAQDAPPTRPAEEAIDFNKARSLIEKMRKGEKLSPDEQAYVERARAARLRMQREGNERPATRPGARPGGRPAVGPGGAFEPKESIGLTPLADLTADQNYQGFAGGLYGGGKNEPPEAHAKAAAAAAQSVQPLNAEGKPDEQGKIVLLSIGMSNTTQEFSKFQQLANRDRDKSPALTIVDAAQGGRAADDWTDPKMGTFEEAARRLSAAGVSPEQVQVVWIKQARKGPASLGAFPKHAEALQSDLEKILRAAKQRYPNLKLAFLSSRIYAGYATGGLNPEPYAYEGAFSVQWAIAKQMSGDKGLNFDPAKGDVVAPVALWGPYLWADGTKGRKTDDLTYTRDDLARDGTHPSDSGKQKVAEQLLAFFKSSPYAKGWFVR